MARHPKWFEHLDAVLEIVRHAEFEWLGRKEVQAVFACSERDSIRMLHKFGAEERDDSLCLIRSSLLTQLDAIRRGSTYAAFLRQRQGVARHLTLARSETAARHFQVRHPLPEQGRLQFQDLPATITLLRAKPPGLGRFEILYKDGADLMSQLAEFLKIAGVNREEFFDATEPVDGHGR
jgi:hypothetical protein